MDVIRQTNTSNVKQPSSQNEKEMRMNKKRETRKGKKNKLEDYLVTGAYRNRKCQVLCYSGIWRLYVRCNDVLFYDSKYFSSLSIETFA